MIEFSKTLGPGDYKAGIVNSVNEIPMGSMLKIEWEHDKGVFVLDRVEPAIFAKPVNYGFIPSTLDEDGDELDTLVVCAEPIPTGVVVEGRIVGIMNFNDGGDADHKVVVVPTDERDTDNRVKNLEDLGEGWKRKIEHHFNHYKDLYKPGSTKVLGWGDAEEAKKVVAESIERYASK